MQEGWCPRTVKANDKSFWVITVTFGLGKSPWMVELWEACTPAALCSWEWFPREKEGSLVRSLARCPGLMWVSCVPLKLQRRRRVPCSAPTVRPRSQSCFV